MESYLKTWLRRLLVAVPVLCLIISVAMWKHTRNETFDIQTGQREMKAAFDEKVQKLHNEVNNLHARKREMQNQIESESAKLQQQQQQLRDELDNLSLQKRELQSQIKRDTVRFKRQLTKVTKTANRAKRETPTGGGAVYVHWGRMNCSSTTNLVYSGIAGGGLNTWKGAAVNMLCMTKTPVWAKYGNDSDYYTLIWGTEYEVKSNDFPLGHARAENLHNHDVPCSVCQSPTRTNVIMIPGTTQCVAGWTVEYIGYLMAGHHAHPASTEYDCIDANPDAHESGRSKENSRILLRVKGKCGSLPCPPYVELREITCVVCSK